MGEEYFQEDPEDSTRSICNICQSSFVTANMVRHLQAKHEDVVKDTLGVAKPSTKEELKDNDSDCKSDPCDVKQSVNTSIAESPEEISRKEEIQFSSPSKEETKSPDGKYVSPVYKYYEQVPGGDPNKHKCTLCGKILSYGSANGKTCHMRKHLRVVHKLELFIRPKVNRNPVNKMGQEYYYKDPDDSSKVICKICHKTYGASNIIRHLQALHEDIVKETLNITRYQCSQCDYSSIDIQQLKIHERKHTEDRSYKCEDCGAGFYSMSNLTSHKKNANCLKLDRERICDDCGKVFKSALALHSHRKLSTKGTCGLEEKPFGCSICNQHFSKESRLEYHMKIHLGEMPFQCQSCGQQFKYESGLKNHNCGRGPLVCHLCGKHYTCEATLKNHKCKMS